jgi:hypothetical protein
MIVVSLQSIEFTSVDIDYLFYVCHIVVRNFNALSDLSTSFLSVDFKQYGVFGLFRLPLAFGLASSEGRSQRAAKSLFAFTLSFGKLVTSRHMLIMLSTMFRSWCIKSILWGSINALAYPKTTFMCRVVIFTITFKHIIF